MSKIIVKTEAINNTLKCVVTGPRAWNDRIMNFSADTIAADTDSNFAFVFTILNNIYSSLAKFPTHGAAIAARYETKYVVSWKISATSLDRGRISHEQYVAEKLFGIKPDHVEITVTKQSTDA